MSPALEQQLRERYPNIFEREPAFECGDGWFDLIDTLCGLLQAVTERGGPQVVAQQVKEKFGGLRFYTAGVNDEQDEMIELAEAMSQRICDVCGNQGKVYSQGWVGTRCAAHGPEKPKLVLV